MHTLSMIDLFSGIGGIRLAFEKAGVICKASSEIDKAARETYEMNFHDIPLGDITKIDGKTLPEFDILAGGFPCQPFSLAGKRLGFTDTRGTLFFEVARLLKECTPKAFFLENVQGLVNHDHGNTLKVIENTLTELGYDFKWKVMNAKDYGIPQNRSRWYCVGFRKNLNITFDNGLNDDRNFNFPDKCNLLYTITDVIEDDNHPDYKVSEIALKNIDSNAKLKEDRLQNVEYPILVNEIRPSRCNFRFDGISPCLTAKMGTGGNNIPVIMDLRRKLTEKECLHIMSFPKEFKIKQNCMASYKQIGNSVVVEVVYQIAKEMVRVLSSL